MAVLVMVWMVMWVRMLRLWSRVWVRRRRTSLPAAYAVFFHLRKWCQGAYLVVFVSVYI
jgi:hypothetical protein